MLLVDADMRLLIGLVYGMLQNAKSDNQVACKKREPIFGLVTEIIEKKIKDMLGNLLQLAYYNLSLYYIRIKFPKKTTL